MRRITASSVSFLQRHKNRDNVNSNTTIINLCPSTSASRGQKCNYYIRYVRSVKRYITWNVSDICVPGGLQLSAGDYQCVTLRFCVPASVPAAKERPHAALQAAWAAAEETGAPRGSARRLSRARRVASVSEKVA